MATHSSTLAWKIPWTGGLVGCGVAKSRTRLSDFTFTVHFHALEEEMATHSSVLAWRIPGTGEPGGLPSMGLQSRTRLKWLSSSSVSHSVMSLCSPMDCSPPGSSVHGILQARILEWIAIPFSRGSSWPRDQIQVSHTAGRFFIIWAIGEDLNCI